MIVARHEQGTQLPVRVRASKILRESYRVRVGRAISSAYDVSIKKMLHLIAKDQGCAGNTDQEYIQSNPDPNDEMNLEYQLTPPEETRLLDVAHLKSPDLEPVTQRDDDGAPHTIKAVAASEAGGHMSFVAEVGRIR